MPQNADTKAFATSFAQLASSILSQKIPSITNKMLGFQVVDKDDSSSRAVGFFAFDLNGQLCYVPAFFLRGEIKGLDLLYFKDKDIFVPLDEQWVSFIETKRPLNMGDGTGQSQSELGITSPDLSQSSNFNYNSKISSYIPSWASAGLSMFNIRHPNEDKRYTKLAGLVDGLKKTSSNKGYKFLKTITEHYKIAEFITDNYKDDELVSAVRHNKVKVAYLNPVSEEKVEFYTRYNLPKTAALTDREKEDILRGEVVSKDTRTKLAKVLEKEPSCVKSATGPGYYSVLFKDGSFSDAYVLKAFTVGSGRLKTSQAIVYKPTVKKVAVKELRGIVVEDCKEPLNKSELEKKFLSLGENPANAANNDIVMFVDKYGNATKPLRVINTISAESGVLLKVDQSYYSTVSCKTNYISNTVTERQRGNSWPSPACDDEVMTNYNDGFYCPREVLVSNKEVDGLVNVGEKLLVNGKSATMVVLEKYKSSEDCCSQSYSVSSNDAIDSEASKEEIELGDFSDSEKALKKTAAYDKIKIYHSRGSFDITGDKVRAAGVNKLAALNKLAELGIKGNECVELIKKAETNTTTRFHLVKQAFGNIATPYFDPTSNTMAVSPTSQSEVIPTPQGMLDETHDLDFGNFQQKIQTMSSAAATGDKDIFDSAALGSLIDINDPSEEINRYVSDLVLGIDRIGRILFLMYWHYDDFVERYEKNDLVHLEDSLINTFKNLGELTYSLQERAVVDNPSIQGLTLA